MQGSCSGFRKNLGFLHKSRNESFAEMLVLLIHPERVEELPLYVVHSFRVAMLGSPLPEARLATLTTPGYVIKPLRGTEIATIQ